MKKLILASAALTICTALSGCFGSGGDGGSDDDVPARSYEDQETVAAQLADAIVSLSPTDPMSLPTVGSVSYTGVVSIAANSDTIVFLGDLELTADFATNAVAGDLSNVNDSGGASYSGTIPLSDGTIDRNAGPTEAVTGDLIGDVVDVSGDMVSFDTSISGDFFGDDAYLAGDVTGNLTIDGTLTTIEDDKGAFSARSN